MMNVSSLPEIRPLGVQGRQCPNCGLPPRLLQSFLDSAADRTIRIFKCSNCNKLIWED
jgi:hypothetical protein